MGGRNEHPYRKDGATAGCSPHQVFEVKVEFGSMDAFPAPTRLIHEYWMVA